MVRSIGVPSDVLRFLAPMRVLLQKITKPL
jgi:hypothetical protein